MYRKPSKSVKPNRQQPLLRAVRRDALLAIIPAHGLTLCGEWYADQRERGWSRRDVDCAVDDLLDAGLASVTCDRFGRLIVRSRLVLAKEGASRG